MPLTHEPPLGFLRNFALIRGGEHARTLDLKHNGVVPIIDLARVHALAGGVAAVNTRERLEAAADRGALSPDGAANLRDALEFIGTVRLRHQARQIKAGKKPDNFMSPRTCLPSNVTT
ncbi:MAG: putative nucleotidyltransferase substrate binding domain-containing protein [Candidatus Competibacteraceae bacterium]